MGDSVWDDRAPHRTDPPTHPVPPPESTRQRVKVTDAQDGELLNRGYSYYSQAVCFEYAAVLCFCGHADGYPRFFKVDIASGAVERLTVRLPYRSTGEGWWWDRDGWLYLCEGPRLRHLNPLTGEDVVVFDISETHPGCRLWQAHSSDDGQTHNATVDQIVESGPYPHIGTVVFQHGQQTYVPAYGALDESQVTADGAYLVIKENDDNHIITLATGAKRTIYDVDGAVGHSDVGDSLLVGEDNIHGECVSWDLREPLTPARRKVLFSTWNMGHVSVRGGRCLLSGPQSLSLVPLEGGEPVHLIDHGMVGEGYDFQCMGNLDPTGQVAAFVSNKAGRMDLYLAILP